MEEGMPLSDYLHVVRELGKELRSEELAGILQASSEEIGVDSEILMEEIKKHPAQAGELIYLAAEIRKGSADEQAFSDLLVEYVERLGSNLTADIGEESDEKGEQHVRQILTSIESGIFGRLRNLNFKDDLLAKLEEKFNDRVDGILEKVKLEWIQSRSVGERTARVERSVLELMEESIVEGDELREVFQTIRGKVDKDEIDPNNFAQIYAEFTRQQENRAREKKERMPKGVLEGPVLTLLMQKEIARAKRYKLPFSALSFSLVKALPKSPGASGKISYHKFLAAFCQLLSKVVREADMIGELGRNRFVVLLPMTSGNQARLALKRCLRLLHSSPAEVDGIPLDIRVAGVVTVYDFLRTPDVESFIRNLEDELGQMERRIRNLQVYF
jgi:hypothetical protein